MKNDSGTIDLMQGLRESGAYITTVFGEPASKANSRQIVKIHGVLRVIKSKKAREYSRDFSRQVVPVEPLLGGDLIFGAKVFYKTRRPDLDESLILDLLQDVAYKNDRQVKAKFVLHGLSKTNPRTEIIVAPVEQMEEVIQLLININQGE